MGLLSRVGTPGTTLSCLASLLVPLPQDLGASLPPKLFAHLPCSVVSLCSVYCKELYVKASTNRSHLTCLIIIVIWLKYMTVMNDDGILRY